MSGPAPNLRDTVAVFPLIVFVLILSGVHFGFSRLAVLNTPSVTFVAAVASASCGQGDPAINAQCKPESSSATYQCDARVNKTKPNEPKKGAQCMKNAPCNGTVGGHKVVGHCDTALCCHTDTVDGQAPKGLPTEQMLSQGQGQPPGGGDTPQSPQSPAQSTGQANTQPQSGLSPVDNHPDPERTANDRVNDTFNDIKQYENTETNARVNDAFNELSPQLLKQEENAHAMDAFYRSDVSPEMRASQNYQEIVMISNGIDPATGQNFLSDAANGNALGASGQGSFGSESTFVANPGGFDNNWQSFRQSDNIEDRRGEDYAAPSSWSDTVVSSIRNAVNTASTWVNNVGTTVYNYFH